MAVNKVPQTSAITIKVQTGLDAKGQAVYRQRIYRSVKTSAVDADVYAVAQALGDLQSHPVQGITRMDEGKLLNA